MRNPTLMACPMLRAAAAATRTMLGICIGTIPASNDGSRPSHNTVNVLVWPGNEGIDRAHVRPGTSHRAWRSGRAGMMSAIHSGFPVGSSAHVRGKCARCGTSRARTISGRVLFVSRRRPCGVYKIAAAQLMERQFLRRTAASGASSNIRHHHPTSTWPGSV